MVSLAALATRNFTTVLAGILIASPVAGFLPMRAFRFEQPSDARQDKNAVLLGFLHRSLTQFIQELSSCLIVHLTAFSKVPNQLRLSHPSRSHSPPISEESDHYTPPLSEAAISTPSMESSFRGNLGAAGNLLPAVPLTGRVQTKGTSRGEEFWRRSKESVIRQQNALLRRKWPILRLCRNRNPANASVTG